MALPVNFWRSEHLSNIFRTKPCQRLIRSGCCEWKSQCQYSHDPDWARRPPRKIRYSPELCPDLQVTRSENGECVIANKCSLGQRCLYAHSKEEVLFHPQVLKTRLCDECTKKSSRKSTKRGCHRFYCPFAHGEAELRETTLTQETLDKYLESVRVFPFAECCHICSPSELKRQPLPSPKTEATKPLPSNIAAPLPSWPVHPGVSTYQSTNPGAMAVYPTYQGALPLAPPAQAALQMMGYPAPCGQDTSMAGRVLQLAPAAASPEGCGMTMQGKPPNATPVQMVQMPTMPAAGVHPGGCNMMAPFAGPGQQLQMIPMTNGMALPESAMVVNGYAGAMPMGIMGWPVPGQAPQPYMSLQGMNPMQPQLVQQVHPPSLQQMQQTQQLQQQQAKDMDANQIDTRTSSTAPSEPSPVSTSPAPQRKSSHNGDEPPEAVPNQTPTKASRPSRGHRRKAKTTPGSKSTDREL